ncbi:MAG TPA: glycosyltransferase family 4 protein [Caulobacterales bacterium]|nr:glycosyltransferase family 4 protein [Caulobacterales bacterium]
MYDVSDAAEKKTADNRPHSEAKTRQSRLRHIALLGNFPPRRCGIATFTSDLRAAILSADPNLACDIVAMTDPQGDYCYEDAVKLSVRQDHRDDYAAAAGALNGDGVELVCVQHEYGIFGGAAGEYLLDLVRGLNCPVVTTLHTALETPNADQARVLNELLRRSGRVVVMSEKGREILMRVHGTSARKIEVIPHGAPDFPMVDTEPFKERFGFQGRDVLLTFGLLSPNKGLENVIRAMPEIVRARPNALYVVLGATHPAMVAREGEAYRERLLAMAEDLGVADNVRFVNTYVETDELLAYLAAADVYVTPYLHEAQITSGTLTYAVALGKAIVSTPYWHAQDLFADGAGVLTPFGDSAAMGRAIAKLLVDPAARESLRRRAYAKGREMVWARVGQRYLRCFEAARHEARMRPARRPSTPTPNFAAVERMSDQCGMLQHARHSVPDRRHGYCVDDNARALMLVHRANAAGLRAPHIAKLAHAYAAFVEYAWNPDNGRFRNFMSFDRRWLEEAGSEDSCGRAFWSVCDTALHAEDEELRRWALGLADRVFPHAKAWTPLRSQTFVGLGLTAFCAAQPARTELHEALRACADKVIAGLTETRRPDWTWFEPALGYDNHRLPQLLLRAHQVLHDDGLKAVGLETLAWLNALHVAPSGVFRPIGSQSFGRPYQRPAPYDQQPLEAAAAIDANWAAFDVTGEAAWAEEAQRAYAWYLGENDAGVRMATSGGGCYDGIASGGINPNQGAESILAFQYATCVMRMRERARRTSSSLLF